MKQWIAEYNPQNEEETLAAMREINQEQILQLLITKIESVAFDSVKEDVVRFIADDQKLAIWSPNYFKDFIQKMKFE